MYFQTKYSMFYSIAVSLLTIEEIKTEQGKFTTAMQILTRPAAEVAINESTDDMWDVQLIPFIKYVYHGGQKPRWVEFSES